MAQSAGITHGISSDVVVAIVRTGELLDTKGMTAFIIERGSRLEKENKLGMRWSETAEVIFEDCFVPDANVVGGEAGVGRGFQQAMQILDGGRISIAALGLGNTIGSYEASVKYAKERQQFGQPISTGSRPEDQTGGYGDQEFQAGELLTMQAADLKNGEKPMTKESAIAKYYTSEIAVPVSTGARQVPRWIWLYRGFPGREVLPRLQAVHHR
jgi:alkylation response protein AidB-like acyl-CoA dehydrogenase